MKLITCVLAVTFLLVNFVSADDLTNLVDIKYFIYAKTNSGVELSQSNIESLKNSLKPSSKKLHIIIHGFLNNQDSAWVQEMKKALLQLPTDSNVLTVTWPSSGLYGNVKSKTPTVGKRVSEILVKLGFDSKANSGQIHCIGHSLGAHVCGFAGKSFKATNGNRLFGRISGLDPAGPGFTGTVDRLDKNDATFVDIYHTNQGSGSTWSEIESYLGITDIIGHLDFVINGGSTQPGCVGLKPLIACSHSMAHEYYTQSIKQKDCFGTKIARAGYFAESGKGGIFRINTNPSQKVNDPSTYCVKA